MNWVDEVEDDVEKSMVKGDKLVEEFISDGVEVTARESHVDLNEAMGMESLNTV